MSASDWVTLSLLILLAVAWFAGAPRNIALSLDERCRNIADAVKRATDIKAEAEAALLAAQQRLQATEVEADRLLRASREAAERLRLSAEEELRLTRERYLRTMNERLDSALQTEIIALRRDAAAAVKAKVTDELIKSDNGVKGAYADEAVHKTASILAYRRRS